MTKAFYVRHRGQVRGPIDFQRLSGLAAAGKLKPFHELADSEDGPWGRADEILPALPFVNPEDTASASVPDDQLTSGARAMHDVFISHSSKDKQTADAVCATLESKGIRCWVAPRDIPPGANWGEAIIDGLGNSRVLVLILSQHANVSPQVMREVERAVSKGIAIIPLRIEDVPLSKSLEYFLSSAHWLDAFTPPLRGHLDNLVQRVQAIVGAAPAGSPRAVPVASPPGKRNDVLRGSLIIAAAFMSAVAIAATVVFFWPQSVMDGTGEDRSTPHPGGQTPPVAQTKDGDVRPSWLGFRYATVPTVVATHYGASPGAIGIGQVHANSPAAKAGLERNDILVSFDGQPVLDVGTWEALKIGELPTGSSHEVKVLRGGNPVSVTVKLEPRPPAVAEQADHVPMMFESRHVDGKGLVTQLELQANVLSWRGNNADPNLAICNVDVKGEALPALYARHVSEVALLPGGKQMVVAGPAEELMLVDTITGEVVRHFETAPGTTYRGCRVSPQADVVATVSNNEKKAVLDIWDIASGKKRSSWNLSDAASEVKVDGGLRVWGEIVKLGSFSPSGRYISTATQNVIAWDVVSGKPLWWWKPPAGLTSWSFSPSWGSCAIADERGSIDIVSLATNSIEHRLRGHTVKGGLYDGVQCIVWHGENLLGSASEGDRTVRIWRLPEGRQIWEYRLEESPNNTFLFGPKTLAFDQARPRLWTGVMCVREFEIPPCDAASWVVPEPKTESLDVATLTPAATPGPPLADKTVVKKPGLQIRISSTATFGDGSRSESFTFQDDSEVRLRFSPDGGPPGAELRSPGGKPFSGELGLTVAASNGRVIVEDLDEEGPASRAGLVIGDAVLGIAEAGADDFIPLPADDTNKAAAMRLRFVAGDAGSKARIKVERAGAAGGDAPRRLVVDVTRGERPAELTIREARFAPGLQRVIEFSDGSRLDVAARADGSEKKYLVIGPDGRRLVADLGMTCSLEGQSLVVTAVADSGPAAEAGIRNGDSVLAIGETEDKRLTPYSWSDKEKAGWLWLRLSHGVPGSKARLRIRRGSDDPSTKPVIVMPTRGAPTSSAQRPKAARVDWTNGLGMPFILVKPGRFFMGAASFVSRDDAPVHYARISRPFLISAFEVTQAEYAQVAPEHVSAFSALGKQREKILRAFSEGVLPDLDTSHLPVDSVTWGEAVAFCDKLGEREQVPYRLPTEAEWEYACRAAGAVRWDEDVDFDPAMDQSAVFMAYAPQSVGSRSPNDLGIYDMFGNVAEWCRDAYDPTYLRSAARVDPTGPADGLKRVARGGGHDAQFQTLYQRAGFTPNEKRGSLGFRVVIPLVGDVGADETLKKLAAAHAPSRPDVTVIPARPAIVDLPVQSMDDEAKALDRLSAEMRATPSAAVQRAEDTIPTFQRLCERCTMELAKLKPAAAKAVNLYIEGKRNSGAGELDLELRCYQQALEFDSLLGWPANDIAWELATAMPEERRDADEAIRYAIAACRASGWRYWGHLDTLAAALAAAGEHEAAVTLAEAVLPHVPEDSRAAFLHSLERYRAGQAYAPLEK